MTPPEAEGRAKDLEYIAGDSVLREIDRQLLRKAAALLRSQAAQIERLTQPMTKAEAEAFARRKIDEDPNGWCSVYIYVNVMLDLGLIKHE